MVLKKLDTRIRTLVENGVVTKHRSMFVIVGDKSRDQVVNLYEFLAKTVVRARPSVLWCYKKALELSSHRKKRMRQIEKKIKSGRLDVNESDPFELFVASTNIRYTYYKDTHKILGNTYGMCVLQDFEALTPNLLARTIETVEGGGLVVLLLKSLDSLKQLYTMTMDVHARYRTESHQDVVGRFNERFILSMSKCKNCMLIDDKLNVLPTSSETLIIKPIPPKPIDAELTGPERELVELKESLQDTQPVGVLVNCTRTLDQGKALLKFIEAISEKTLRSTVVMTASRGRGKSAALGLAMASAVAFGYSNIFVTAPSPENLKTMFEFIFKGFDALQYEEHTHYELVQSTNPEFNKAIVRVNIYREHRQTIQYIHPGDAHKLGQAELVCIDEAAAIPLPLVEKLLGPYLVFMSSTVNGYEGTGRSLSLKLVEKLRKASAGGKVGESNLSGRLLHEVTLNESIRYGNGDAVEKWLNDLLCLDASSVPRVISGSPDPATCDLYYVNRDTLFSFRPAAEAFLQRLMALYVSSHYKNTPNDLQMLSDAPAHHIFCLLGPMASNTDKLPEVLCVLQVCLEGEISKKNVMYSLGRGQRASGDLIPWTVSQQFQDSDFPTLSGARIVRIATHPDFQSRGYGKRALELLCSYYEGKMLSLTENEEKEEPQKAVKNISSETVTLLTERLEPQTNLPGLLRTLSERRPETLQYLGVSYGLTEPLLKFWKRAGYTPVYLRQTPNDLTGEHSCIMLKILQQGDEEQTPQSENWLSLYWKDFRKRFVSLLSYDFRAFTPKLALSILDQKKLKETTKDLSKKELEWSLSMYDLKRLELYSDNMADYHLIMDLLPKLANLFFLNKVKIHLSPPVTQAAILLGLGLQHKRVDDLVKELDLEDKQILGLFNRAIRKFKEVLMKIEERAIEQATPEERDVTMKPMRQTMEEELSEAARDVEASQRKELKVAGIDLSDLAQFAIKGSEDDWQKEQNVRGKAGTISIKRAQEKKRKVEESTETAPKHKKHKKNKHRK